LKIEAIESWSESFALTRPYAVAFGHTEAAESAIVGLRADDGRVGWGAATPDPRVTGETIEACRAALEPESLGWLRGRDLRQRRALLSELASRIRAAPGARAAVDMAIHDLAAQAVEVPLVELLGRAHEALPTSITIGIKPLAETLEEAGEYLGRGFRILKVKVGNSYEEDLERLIRLRERVGPGIAIRVDANQGYDEAETVRFFPDTAALDLEFLEQPLPADAVETMRRLPEEAKERIAADESLLDERDALRLAAPRACGIFNIKLMKCGGIEPALRIAAIAETAGVALMWGCMDESVIGIAAALHAALASPATRYLDLDGSLDLARDVARGGFVLEEGILRTTSAPGLGVSPL
jgi:L-alanine-DL-glutamate epimerase-like enolase superfamily enzyme